MADLYNYIDEHPFLLPQQFISSLPVHIILSSNDLPSVSPIHTRNLHTTRPSLCKIGRQRLFSCLAPTTSNKPNRTSKEPCLKKITVYLSKKKCIVQRGQSDSLLHDNKEQELQSTFQDFWIERKDWCLLLNSEADKEKRDQRVYRAVHPSKPIRSRWGSLSLHLAEKAQEEQSAPQISLDPKSPQNSD